MPKQITPDQARKFQERAEKARARMTKAYKAQNYAASERWASLWARLVGKISAYKRQRQRKDQA